MIQKKNGLNNREMIEAVKAAKIYGVALKYANAQQRDTISRASMGAFMDGEKRGNSDCHGAQ